MQPQLALNVELQPQYDFGNFVPGRNRELLAQLCSDSEPFIYIWGQAGYGKSHLLQASCRYHGAVEKRCAYLPLRDFSSASPNLFEGISTYDLVCLDDLQCVVGDSAWEQALFNLFNQLRGSQRRLFIAADRAGGALAIKLPDLASRLTWGPSYRLEPLDDTGRLEMLQQGLQQRGLELPADAAQFLLHRLPRDLPSLTQIIHRLDQASLAAKRKLTIPFIRETLLL